MNKKGFYPLYSTLGALVLVMVIAISLQWRAQDDQEFVAHVDRLQYLKLNHAVENTKTTIAAAIKDSLYDAVMDIGKIRTGTVNRYLNHSFDAGWDMIVEEIKRKTHQNFYEHIESAADYCDGNRAYFYFDDGINITLTGLESSEIRFEFVGDDEEFMDAVVPLPSIITGRYGEWKGEEGPQEIRIPLNVRLRDMYERAWDFHHNFENNAKTALTLALYGRAYLAAYGDGVFESMSDKLGIAPDGNSTRAFLKVAHYGFDPIAVLLYGSMGDIEEFLTHPLDIFDTGAVPAAVWYTEWAELSEPSFVPPGVDLHGEDVDNAKDMITANYDFASMQEEVCDDLTGEEKEQCESLYDKLDLEALYSDVEASWLHVKDISDKVHDRLLEYTEALREYDDSYDDCRDGYSDCGDRLVSCQDRCDDSTDEHCDDLCEVSYEWCRADHGRDNCHMEALEDAFGSIALDHFREDAIEAMTLALEAMADEAPGITDQGEAEAKETMRSDYPGDPQRKFKDNANETGFEQTDRLISQTLASKSDLESLLLEMGRVDVPDCGSYEDDCEFDSDCVKWDCSPSPSCSGPRCGRGNDHYECVGNEPAGSRTKTCEVLKRDSEEKQSLTISQCGCRAYPNLDLVEELAEALYWANRSLSKAEETLHGQVDSLGQQLENHRKSEEFEELIDGLRGEEFSYDVISRLDMNYVRFDTGWAGWWNYTPGDYAQRGNGVCGDATESVILYSAQIAAASFATFFSAGAASALLDYAIDFFPLIIESEASFEMTETLIDDGNRMILTNLASTGSRLGESGDSRLFTYAPFEFEIYKKHEFRIGALTGNRVIVYLYLPAFEDGMSRAVDGLSDCLEAKPDEDEK